MLKRATASLGLAAGLLLGGQSATAGAATLRPTGLYAQFADCPVADTALEDCLRASVSAGALTVGHKTVPVGRPIVVQGGFYLRAPEQVEFVGAEDGATISSTPLSVPGGLSSVLSVASLPASLQAQARNSQQEVTMTLQLARAASQIELSTENFIFGEGVALQLPLKIRLNNPLLGGNCYIGSSGDPVLLSTTTGVTSPPPPNRPLAGKPGTFKLLDELRLFSLSEATLVENSYAVPGASGCGPIGTTVVDSALDAAIGLPSPAGRNAAVLHTTLYVALAEAVLESA